MNDARSRSGTAPGTSSGEPAIVASDLVKRYDEVHAVRGVSFEVAPGEVVGFLGPNGAGKTTTVRMISCFLPPTSGTARVFGVDVRERPRPDLADHGRLDCLRRAQGPDDQHVQGDRN